MDRFRAQTFFRRLLEDGYMRGHLEQVLGYDNLHEIKEGIAKGDFRNIGSLVEYIRAVCDELEKVI